MKLVVPAAENAGAKRILEIRMKIGALSGVFPEAVRDCLALVARGTIAEGVELAVEEIPLKISCRDCGRENEGPRNAKECPDCGSRNFKLTSGIEYFVDSLKVE